jgi:hypothetical protein
MAPLIEKIGKRLAPKIAAAAVNSIASLKTVPVPWAQ